jgi:hypothetical protein
VDLVDVEVGGYYELVVTMFTGEPPCAHATHAEGGEKMVVRRD